MGLRGILGVSTIAHIVGPWVIDGIKLYRDLRTGTQYMGSWASRDFDLEFRLVHGQS